MTQSSAIVMRRTEVSADNAAHSNNAGIMIDGPVPAEEDSRGGERRSEV